ncbi:hypothetical protein RF11_06618 [Thelohanellus kitauei]|uniref:Uncharacterized protein n=1 Tax=Thelohanellus kitauei TaxID=669202 RepID=A0A0C2MM02_THEKT|nr:hypothetical protein RF11_06618 [Thelohanellus kitauei]
MCACLSKGNNKQLENPNGRKVYSRFFLNSLGNKPYPIYVGAIIKSKEVKMCDTDANTETSEVPEITSEPLHAATDKTYIVCSESSNIQQNIRQKIKVTRRSERLRLKTEAEYRGEV